MRVKISSQEVKRRCKAEKIDIDNITIEKVLQFHYEDMLDKLARGEEFRISSIGKITPTYKAGVSFLNQTQTEYETIKFGFTAFKELKSKAKENLNRAKQKNI